MCTEMTAILNLLLAALACATALAAEPCASGEEFAPHPTDCALFYACDGAGGAVIESCPPGLWWNPTVSTCDWPDVAFCSTGSSSTDTSPTGTSPTGTSSDASSTASSAGSTVVSPCVGNEPEFFPHPTDCTLFYKCYQGEAVLETCPPGLWWHQSLGQCDWPDQEFCTPGSSTSSTASTATPTGSTASPGGPAMPCPEVDAEPIRYAHAKDCSLYHLCVMGSTTVYTCSPGDQFSPTARRCVSADAAGCDRCPKEDSVDLVVRLPHETQCHLYYMCHAGQTTMYQCQLEDHFSRFDRLCHTPAQAFCSLLA